MGKTVAEIADLIEGEVQGNGSLTILGLSPFDNVQPNTIVYAETEKHLKQVESTQAVAVLTEAGLKSDKKTLIHVAKPYKAFVKLIDYFYPSSPVSAGIHPTAVISDEAKIGEKVWIGPYVVVGSGSVIGDGASLSSHVHIGENVTIGKNAMLHPQVVVYNGCQLGARVIIHASSVVGSDGFGYKYIDGVHVKMPHVGNVIIEDDVEIGANTTIDRGALSSTVIGAGTKIDNQVQVAHSVKLGRNNILCAFTGIAGSTQCGDEVIFAANVGVSDHVRIDDQVILGARTGVPPGKHLKQGEVYFGSPARPKDQAIKLDMGVTRIPSMRKQLSQLKETVYALTKRLAELEAETHE